MKHSTWFILFVVMVALLIAAFFLPDLLEKGETPANQQEETQLDTENPTETEEQKTPADEEKNTEENNAEENPGLEEGNPSSGQGTTASAPTSNPEAETQYVTISIDCHTAVASADLPANLKEILPADGMILSNYSVALTDGATAFSVLQTACQENNIPYEHAATVAYNSSYLEGLANLYEFDCGSLSGWVYGVNDVFPSYSSSEYTVEAGDHILFIYTCDLGQDVGAVQ